MTLTEAAANSIVGARVVLDLIDDILVTLAETIDDGLFPEIGYYGS